MTTLTDAGDVKNLISDEDIYSVSEPDSNGKVRAIINLGGRMVLVEGRRIFAGVAS